MSTSALIRLAFMALDPRRVRALLDRHGGVVAAMEAIDAGHEPGLEAPPAPWCHERVERWGGTFEPAAGSSWIGRFGHVEDPPLWLFRSGRSDDRAYVAIVGTRRCTEYGRRIARDLSAACAAARWGVVSGLARGIDAAAHRGALDASGHTVAVLGSGPDIRYPRSNDGLRRSILAEGGCIVSEYPPGAEPLPWRFPPRNRIISGLSSAVVVVESAATGGSLSTAARAVAQGRPVFAVPGDIDRPASIGCNLLIRDGAIPVLGPDDLVQGLEVVLDLGR
jgi:DNA processing protein